MNNKIDFTKGIVKSKRIVDNLTSGIVKYDKSTDTFVIDVKGVRYQTNAYDFANKKILYAKPVNDAHVDWKKTRANLNDESRFNTIARFWSCIKDKQVVRGKIVDDVFIIVKY